LFGTASAYRPIETFVDEDAAVDLDEVDEVLAAVDEGVEGPADVVPVHPQVPAKWLRVPAGMPA